MAKEYDFLEQPDGYENVSASLMQAAVAACTHDCLTISDPHAPDNPLIYVSPGFEQVTGYSASEVLGKNCRFLQGDDHDQEPLHILRRAIQNATSCQVVLGNYRKNGEFFWNQLNLYPIRDRNGNLTHFAGVQHDITERKELEAKRLRLLADLEEKNFELEEFAHIVSHDLKAPLRAIGTLTEWLGNDYADQLDSEGQRLLKLLFNRTGRMERLIEGILQYSRLGKSTQPYESVAVDDLVSDIIDGLMPPQGVKINCANPLPQVWVQRIPLTQVLQNLLSNAIKFMDKSPAEIGIDCIDENVYWQFSVSDNGPGIDAQYFDKIFQIFQTLKSRDEFETTGIGLTICKRIVQSWGGRIWLESQPGQGSTFFFTLPKEKA